MQHLLALDRAVFQALYAGPVPGTAYSLMLALTLLGTGWIMLILLPFLFAPRSRRVAGELLSVLLSVAALVFVLKLLVRRTRPYLVLGVTGWGWHVPQDFSFPSGHAAGSFAFVWFLTTRLRLPRALIGVLFVIASGIAFSRVYLGVHFPGDVLAGALLGSLGGGMCGAWLRRRTTPTCQPTEPAA